MKFFRVVRDDLGAAHVMRVLTWSALVASLPADADHVNLSGSIRGPANPDRSTATRDSSSNPRGCNSPFCLMLRCLSQALPFAAAAAALWFACPSVAAPVAFSVDEYPLRPVAPFKSAATVDQIEYYPNAFDDHGFNRVVRKTSVPTLTVYRPMHVGHRGAAFVVCPGGGYEGVVIDREGYAFGRYFAARGLTVAVLKYRLPDGDASHAPIPLPQQDALAAVAYVRRNAPAWGIDPHRVGILGCSAGGHLAASVGFLGTAVAGTRPDFVALLYPVVCMEPPYAHAGSVRNLLGASPTKQRLEQFSWEQQARPGLPPFFLVHARDDRTVPPQNSELLAAALQAQHVPAELLLVDKGGHGFSLGRGPESSIWKARFLAWLDHLP